MAEETPAPTDAQVAAINSDIRYAMYSVFRVHAPLTESAQEQVRSRYVAPLQEALATLEAEGLVIRGWYDVSALRADADIMIWWHAADVETLQAAYRLVRRSALGEHLEPVWSSVGLHRPAEFNKSHVPAFLTGEAPRDYLCVYPFVRSYEWYLLEEEDRRSMLREHGLAAKDYADVRANTISSFALNDYEWLLAFEADELHRIVDLMRELRAVRARLHVREEVPFFTGRRRDLGDLVAALP